jgi:hypothetical protein
MGKASFKKKDKNRFRKVYPYLRKAPVWEYCSPTKVEIEVGLISFNGTTTGTYTFTETFESVPRITAISVAKIGNVNVWVTGVTTTYVTIETSAPFTGDIHFHAIRTC